MWRRNEQVDILVVCTGNVCRSPYIAARLRQELPELTIASAGTGALVGERPTSQVRDLLTACEIEADDLPPARALRRGMVRGARLVITAERGHRVVTSRLGGDDRSFTLLELARIVRSSGAPVGLGVVAVADLAHTAVAGGEDRDHDDDLADPYERDGADYLVMATRAEEALLLLAPVLRMSSASVGSELPD